MKKQIATSVFCLFTVLPISCTTTGTTPPSVQVISAPPSYSTGGYNNDYAGSTGYGADYIYSTSYYGQRPYWINRFTAPEVAPETPLASSL